MVFVGQALPFLREKLFPNLTSGRFSNSRLLALFSW